MMPEGWQVVERDGIPRLSREFAFKEFADALAFAVQVGMLAERLDHHPAVLVEWGRLTVTYWTHKEKGLTEKDYAGAAEVDKLYRPLKASR